MEERGRKRESSGENGRKRKGGGEKGWVPLPLILSPFSHVLTGTTEKLRKEQKQKKGVLERKGEIIRNWQQFC